MNRLTLFATALVLLFAGNLYAQGPYAQLRFGYSFSLESGNKQGFETTEDINFSVQSQKDIYTSGGQGTHIGLGLGYMISKHLGAELGIDYYMNAKEQTQTRNFVDAGNGNSFGDYVRHDYSRQIRLIPALVVTTGSEGISPYARFGLVLPVGGKTHSEVESMVSVLPGFAERNVSVKAETAGTPSVGFNAAFGTTFSISENLVLFGEVDFVSLSIAAKDTKFTEYTETGVNFGTEYAIGLDDLKVYEKETVYSAEVTSKSNNPTYNSDFDSNDEAYHGKALEDLAPVRDYSGVGLNLGLRFKF